MYLTPEKIEKFYDGGDPGYCMECDDVTRENGVEPDADGYCCPACGKQAVMGLETAVVTGHVVIDD